MPDDPTGTDAGTTDDAPPAIQDALDAITDLDGVSYDDRDHATILAIEPAAYDVRWTISITTTAEHVTDAIADVVADLDGVTTVKETDLALDIVQEDTAAGDDVTTEHVPSEADLDHLRDDVRRDARPTITRACPEADCDGTDHHLFEQYPAVLTTGAWGKYLNPVYRCQDCETAHTLLCYEADPDADRPEWGPYPPEAEARDDAGTTDDSTDESAFQPVPCPECPDGTLRVSDGVYADCDTCDAAVLRNEVGL